MCNCDHTHTPLTHSLSPSLSLSLKYTQRLRQNDPPILLGQVKVPDEIELAKRYGITGYPLLFIFRNGKQYNYTGPREEEGSKERVNAQ